MNQTGKCNTFSLDVGAVKAAQQEYYEDVLDAAADQLLDLMQKEVLREKYGKSPGKPAWREKMRNMLKVVHKDIANHFIERSVGMPDNLKLTDLVKVMIINYGSGIAVGNPMITAGPPGRMVWDDDITGKFPSEAESHYLLPKEFNQMGNLFIENSVQMMEKHFKDILETASRDLPDSVFYQNVIVKQR